MYTSDMRSNMHHSIDSFLINMAIPFKASLLRYHLLVSQHAPTRTLFSLGVPNMNLYLKPGSYLRTISLSNHPHVSLKEDI